MEGSILQTDSDADQETTAQRYILRCEQTDHRSQVKSLDSDLVQSQTH
jgi:hypothetical protein